MPPFPTSAVAYLVKHLEAFSCLNVDEAPESPGLYAWYGLLNAGPQDWELNLAAGEDLGAQACRTLLQQHSSRFASPPLRLEARGTFSSIWRGDLRDASAERLRTILAGEVAAVEKDPTSDENQQRLLDSVLASSKLREILLGILKAATPILSAPMYIGVAMSLRARLRQHVDMLFKLASTAPASPRERERLLADSRFASRAIGMGFSADTLSVWTLNLASLYPDHSDQEALRVVAETAEWLLNRWHRPLLGRR
jgi:hypothetical protein